MRTGSMKYPVPICCNRCGTEVGKMNNVSDVYYVGPCPKCRYKMLDAAYWEGYTDHQALTEDSIYREEFTKAFKQALVRLGRKWGDNNPILTPELITREALKILHKNLSL